MDLKKFIVSVLAAAAATPAFAQSNGFDGNATISRVETVYVREAAGLFIEKRLLRNAAHKELWVGVRFADSMPGESTGDLFQVPAEIMIERGDLVSTRIGDPTARAMKLLPDLNRVTRLVAKYDTLMAMAFGLGNPGRTQGFFAEAQACWSPAQNQMADAAAYSR